MNTSLFKAELKKLCGIVTLLLFVGIILQKVVFSDLDLPQFYDFSEEKYRNYISVMQSKTPNEQGKFIAQEEIRINDIISVKNEMENKYLKGEITLDEFSDYNYSYSVANNELKPLELIKHRYEYFEEIRGEGKEPEFFFEYTILDSLEDLCKMDFLFVAFVIFAVTNMLSMDTDHKMQDTVLSTRYGRRKIYKILSIILFTLVLYVITSGFEFYTKVRECDYTLLNSMLYNLEEYRYCKYSITIGEYITLMFVMRGVWTVVLGFFAFAVYSVLKNKMTSLFVIAVLVFLPGLLSGSLGDKLPRVLIGPQLIGIAVQGNHIAISLISALVSVIIFTISQSRT